MHAIPQAFTLKVYCLPGNKFNSLYSNFNRHTYNDESCPIDIGSLLIDRIPSDIKIPYKRLDRG